MRTEMFSFCFKILAEHLLAGLKRTAKTSRPAGRESEAQFLTPQPRRNWWHGRGMVEYPPPQGRWEVPFFDGIPRPKLENNRKI
jgi:hypothetical protein